MSEYVDVYDKDTGEHLFHKNGSKAYVRGVRIAIEHNKRTGHITELLMRSDPEESPYWRYRWGEERGERERRNRILEHSKRISEYYLERRGKVLDLEACARELGIPKDEAWDAVQASIGRGQLIVDGDQWRLLPQTGFLSSPREIKLGVPPQGFKIYRPGWEKIPAGRHRMPSSYTHPFIPTYSTQEKVKACEHRSGSVVDTAVEVPLPEKVLYRHPQCMKCGAFLICECKKWWYQKYISGYAELFPKPVVFIPNFCPACRDPKSYQEHQKMAREAGALYGDTEHWERLVMRSIELMREQDDELYEYFFKPPKSEYAEDLEKGREEKIRERIDEFQGFKRMAKNEIRTELGLPGVGEGWVRESQLYNLVKKMIPDHRVIRYASPHWLGDQHLDIYVPQLKIAIEYMGRQHFETIDFFGGGEAFRTIKGYDKRKKKLCRQNNITLIYFTYKDVLSEENVRRALKIQKPVWYGKNSNGRN